MGRQNAYAKKGKANMDRNMDMGAEWREDYASEDDRMCECWKDDRYMYGCPHDASDPILVESKILRWIEEWDNEARLASHRPRMSPIW